MTFRFVLMTPVLGTVNRRAEDRAALHRSPHVAHSDRSAGQSPEEQPSIIPHDFAMVATAGNELDSDFAFALPWNDLSLRRASKAR
jgi:hypothetical protein